MLFTQWLKGFANRVLSTRRRIGSGSRRSQARGTSLAMRSSSFIVSPGGESHSPEFANVIERLEDRSLLATITWVGDVSGNWNGNSAGNTNWSGDVLPTDGDTLVFDGTGANFTQVNDTTAANSYTLQFTAGGYSISGASITLDNGGTDISSTTGSNSLSTPLIDATSVIDVSGGTVTLAGAISGSGGLSKTGGGTLELTATNTYTGTTSVSAGTVNLNAASDAIPDNLTVSGGSVVEQAADQIANAANVIVSGGTLNIGANSDTVAGVQLASGNITGTGGTLTSSSDFDLRSGSASAILGGGVGASKTTGGTVNLTGANTYTGTTTVNAGTLNLNTTGGGALAGNLTVAGGSAVEQQADQIANTASLVVSGGMFDIGATSSDTVAGVQLTSGSITGSGAILTSTSAFDLQAGSVSAILGGGVAANKTTGGTVNFTGANTYTGLTTVSGGILNLNTTGGGALAGNLTVSGGSAVEQQANQIADGKSVVVSGGTLDIGVNSDTVMGVQITSGNINGSGGTLTSTSAFDLQAGSISAILGGTVAANKTTGGMVTFTGANSYTGLTTVSAGTLNLNTTGGGALAGSLTVSGGAAVEQQSNQIADAASVVVSGGILDIGANSDTVAGVQITSGSINGSGGILTSTSAFDLQAGSISAILGGTVAANKTTGGTVNFTGANSYTGLTTVSAGLLNLNTTGGGALAGSLTVSSGSAAEQQSNQIADTASVVISGGTLNIAGNSDTVAGVQITSGNINGTTGTLTSTSAFDLQAGAISAKLGGAVAANKTTGGTVTFTGANSYTGLTTVSAGNLNLNTTGGGALAGNLTVSGTGSAVEQQSNQIADTASVIVSAGTLDIGGNSDTVAGVRITANGSITGTTGTLTSTSAFDLRAGSVSAILGGSVAANKTTGGTVNLTGANSYTGLTSVSAGILNLNTTGGGALAGNLTVSGGSAVEQQADQIANTASVVVSGGTFDIAGNNDSVAGVQITSGNISGTTGTLTSGSTFDLQAGSISAILGGAVAANKTTGGVVNFTGANTYSGLTTVSAGTLNLNTTGGGALAGNLTVSGGSAVEQQADQIANTASVIVSGGTLNIGANSDSVAGVQITSGNITGSGGTLASTSAFDLQAGSISAILGGAVAANKTTGGVVNFTGANSYTGLTTVSAGTLNLNTTGGGALTGSLTVSGGSAVELQADQIADAASVVVSGGTFNIGTNSDSVAGVQLTSGNISGTSGTLTSTSAFDLQAGAVSAILGGGVGANKTTGSTVTLSGANTYSGATNITGGTLALSSASNNNIASSTTITVGAGAFLDVTGLNSSRFDLASAQTLNGTGTVSGGALNALSGSNVAPGTSPGILNTGDVSFQSGSSFTVEVNNSAPGTGHDQLNVTGMVSLGGAMLVTSGTITSVPGQEIVLIQNDGTDAVTGTFNGLAEGAMVMIGTANFLLSYAGGAGGNDVTLTELGGVPTPIAGG